MNASEIRNIEEQLQAEPRLPLSQYEMHILMRRAERERAKAIAAMLAAFGAAIVGYFRALRESAATQTGAGLRHS